MKVQIVHQEVKNNLNRQAVTHQTMKKAMKVKNLATIARTLILKILKRLNKKTTMTRIKVKKSLIPMNNKAGLRMAMKKRLITE